MANFNDPWGGYKPFENYRPFGAVEAPTAVTAAPIVSYDPAKGYAKKGTSQEFKALTYRPDYLENYARELGLGEQPSVSYLDEQGNIVTDFNPEDSGLLTLNPTYYDEQSKWQSDYDRYLQLAKDKTLAARDANKVYGQLADLESKGLKYGNKALDSSNQRETIAARLSEYGVSDLSQLGSTEDEQGNPVFYNRQTGERLPDNLGYTSYGEGFTRYKLAPSADNGVVPYATWEDSSDNGKIAQGLSIAAALAAPWALPALGAAAGLGAIGGGSLYGAGTGALTSAIGGGNVVKGALVGGAAGALGGTLGAGAGQYNPAAALTADKATQAVLNSGVRGALSGGLGAAAYGADPLKGALYGGGSGALGSFLSQSLGEAGLNKNVAGGIGGQLSKAAFQQLLQNANSGGISSATSSGGGSSATWPVSATPAISPLAQMVQQKIAEALQRRGLPNG